MQPAGFADALGVRPATCAHVAVTRANASATPRRISALPRPRGLVGASASHQAEGGGGEQGHLDTLDGVEEASYTLATPEELTAVEDVQVPQRQAFHIQATPPPSSHLLPSTPNSLGSAVPLGAGGGWVWAAALLIAARLGRVTAQEARLDVRQLQFERERSRALSKELLQRRREYEAAEGERAAADAARRVEEEAARALEEFRRQQELQKRYQQEAAREAEKLRAAQEVKRQQYEAEQARLDAEYQARLEQERQLIEEQRAKAAAAEAERRRAEEERRRQVEEERRQREEQERREREEAIRVRLEERRRLEREKKKFVLRLEGSVAAERPPKGTLLPGPLQKEAGVRLTAGASSLLGGAGPPATADLAAARDATEALPALVAGAARAAASAYASAVRLQSMAGEGPLAWMDEVELRHWMTLAAARASLAALGAGAEALRAFPSTKTFQVRTEYGVLPADHPQRSSAQFVRVISLIESGSTTDAKHLLLEGDLAEDAAGQLCADLHIPTQLSAVPRPFLPTALLCAHLLDRCLADRPAKISDAPAWFEAAAATIREALQDSASGAPPDSLQAPAALLAGLLGPEHPVSQESARLAEGNLSASTKRERAEREKMAKAELAAKLLEEEWPDANEIKAARVAAKEASTPIPERVWALRNVAGTLSLGGPSERGRARRLLEQAVLLKQQFAGAPDHPAALPELMALLDLLAGEGQWRGDATGVAALIMAALRGVADAYAAAGDPTSATVVLEAGLRKYDELLGVRHPAVSSALRRVEGLRSALTADQRSAVAQWRTKADQVLGRLSEAFTEPLQAYQAGSTPSRAEEWASKGVAWLGPFKEP
ncbi:hypothetical protein N2152v2_004146 [Parachlorella kessleri]